MRAGLVVRLGDLAGDVQGVGVEDLGVFVLADLAQRVRQRLGGLVPAVAIADVAGDLQRAASGNAGRINYQ